MGSKILSTIIAITLAVCVVRTYSASPLLDKITNSYRIETVPDYARIVTATPRMGIREGFAKITTDRKGEVIIIPIRNIPDLTLLAAGTKIRLITVAGGYSGNVERTFQLYSAVRK